MKNSESKKLIFYGRRKGKKLHSARQAALDTALPKFKIDLTEDYIDLPKLFDVAKKSYWLEIGFGTGEVIAHYAMQNPGIGFVGAEPFLNGYSNLLKIITEYNIQNIRIYPDDARALLPKLPDTAFEKIFLLFSDPWPKTRHNKRRFLQTETLVEFSSLLKSGGELRLASDDPGLVEWMFNLTWHHPDFTWNARSKTDWQIRPIDQPLSKYEEKCKSGHEAVYLSFTKNT